jgi:serine/threonine protein kinase
MTTHVIQEMFPELVNGKKIKKSTGSGCCLQFNSVRDEQKVRVKLSFEPKSPYYNNQKVEAQIYEHVLTDIPHVPKWYATITSAFDDKKTNVDMSSWDEGFECWDVSQAQALVLEHVGETSLFFLWKEERENPQILFQILFTLAWFERIGLKHGDLHTSNIMIQKLDTPVTLSYKIDNQVVSFQTTKIVKIIDFDRACIYHSQVERNNYLDFLYEIDFNVYNSVNNGFDAYKILCRYNDDCTGEIKTWLMLTCPQVDLVTYDHDMLPQHISGRELIGPTDKLLVSLAENFPDKFGLHKYATGVVYELPEDVSFKPICDDTKFHVFKCHKTNIAKKYGHIYKELLMLGYNWKLHHIKLYSEIQAGLDLPEEKQEDLYEACMWVTNPIRLHEPNEMVSLVNHEFTPLFILPQKPSEKFKKSWLKKEQKENDDEPEEIDDDDTKPVQVNVETDNDDDNNDDGNRVEVLVGVVDVVLPAKYRTNNTWHKTYSVEEVEEVRKYLMDVGLMYLNDDIRSKLPLYTPFDGTKNWIVNFVRNCLNVVTTLSRKCDKAVLTYIMFAMLARTLSYFSMNHHFLLVIENKVIELKKDNLDLSPLIEFDVPVVPKIETVLGSCFMDTLIEESKARNPQ